MTRRLLALTVLLTLTSTAFTQEPAAGTKYALVIGVNDYRHAKFKNLDFAENDAIVLSKVLKEHGYQVTVLDGKKATLAASASALKHVTAKRGRGDMVFVALAGHGLLFGTESYYCPHDAEPDDPKSMLAIKDVYAELGRSGAGTNLLLVDACREDAVRGKRNAGVDRAPPAPEGVGVLFSCSPGQFSFESKELKHGVFFYYVLEALKGEAKNKRGEVTWDLLRAHVKEHVADKVKDLFPGGKQDPNGVENLSAVPPLVSLRPEISNSIKLFNGKDLDGWEGYSEYWSVKGGVIVARNGAPLKYSTYLMTKRTFSDFRLILSAKLVTSEMHSAVAFWGKRFNPPGVVNAAAEKAEHTYQGHSVMFPSSWGLFDLYRRGGAINPSKEIRDVAINAGKQHDWNDLELLARGNRIRLVVNGVLALDWREPEPRYIGEGPIGLQLHSNSVPQEVHFKGLELTTHPPDKLVTMK